MMLFWKLKIFILPLALLGCASAGDVYHQANRSMSDDLTLLASTAQPVIKNSDGTICYGPQPDATIDEDVSGGNGSIVVGAGDNELPLGGRNPNVLITRDIFFQSCLAEARLKLNRQERQILFNKTLDVIQSINESSLDGSSIESDADSAEQTIVSPGTSTN